MARSKEINWKRLSVAIIVGASVTSMLLGVLQYWFGFAIGRLSPAVEKIPILALTYLIVILVLSVVIGIPAIFTLKRIGLFNEVTVLLVGVLIGAACIIPSVGPQPPPYAEALFFGFGGFAMSALFWLVYAGANKQRNADSGADAPPPVR